MAAGVVAAKADLIAQAIRAVIGVADPHQVVLGGGVRRAEKFLDLVAAQVVATRRRARDRTSTHRSYRGGESAPWATTRWVDGRMDAGNDRLTTSALD